jgi:hypothetical protein
MLEWRTVRVLMKGGVMTMRSTKGKENFQHCQDEQLLWMLWMAGLDLPHTHPLKLPN